MADEETRHLVRTFAERCWGEGATEPAHEIVSTDVVRNGAPVGRDGLLAVIAGIRGGLSDFRTTIDDLIVEGDRAAWRYTSSGTHTGGPLLGVPPTGRSMTWTGTAVLRVAGGGIVEIWDAVDLFSIYRQLGVIADPQVGSRPGS